MALMHEREYKRIRRKIEAEYHEKLKALETIWKLSGGGDSNSAGGQGTPSGKGQLLRLVRHALEDIRGDFTLHTVEERIRLNNPTAASSLKKSSLSSILKRLAGTREIELIQRGSGKRASTFRKGASPPT